MVSQYPIRPVIVTKSYPAVCILVLLVELSFAFLREKRVLLEQETGEWHAIKLREEGRGNHQH